MKSNITSKQLGVEYTINFNQDITPCFRLLQGERKGEILDFGERVDSLGLDFGKVCFKVLNQKDH